MSESWSREEVEATVADYLHMLTMELAGQEYNKSEHRRRLMQRLNGRSDGAVERKHQNISAILIELGLPYISGYKPLGNYQTLLFDVIADRLPQEHSLDRAAAAVVEMPAATPLIEDFTGLVVEPPRVSPAAQDVASPAYATRHRATLHRDYLGREARNMSLGCAGEEFVVEYERWRLLSGRNERLANKVEHVAKTRGDGLGFDVLSFDADGRERLIEVKTTAFGKETPFFISKNEMDLSRGRTDAFHLYRLFEFRKEPKLFTLPGAIERHCRLDAASFIARFS